MNKILITALVCIVISGTAGYFVGKNTANSNSNSYAGRFQRGLGRSGRGINGSVIRGKVISSDANSLTVQFQNGSSKIIVFSGKTRFTKSAQAAKADINPGDSIMVFGTQNSDGSVTAQNVQINPSTMGRQGEMQGVSPTP